MKTIREVATFLSKTWQDSNLKMGELSERTGLSAPTLRGILGGRKDSKLTTLFAVADQLGYEVVIVPKAIAQSLAAPQAVPERKIKSLIGSAVSQSAVGQFAGIGKTRKQDDSE